MSVTWPRAWEITKATRLGEHAPDCAYQKTIGVLLCDCVVLTGHPEYGDGVVPTDG